MANTLSIPERTLAQISESTNSINVIGGADGRLSAYQPLVARITDHADNDAGETGSDTDLMAIFKSCAHGQPWIKDANVLIHKVIEADADPVEITTDTDVSVLYHNFDYSTFE